MGEQDGEEVRRAQMMMERKMERRMEMAGFQFVTAKRSRDGGGEWVSRRGGWRSWE